VTVTLALGLALGALIGSFVSGLAGFAFGLVALTIWLNLVEPGLTGALVVACSLAEQLMAVHALRHAAELDRNWPMVIGGLLGVPLGVVLLGYVDAPMFRRLLGGFLVIYAAISLFVPPVSPFARAGPLADGTIGGVGGVMGGLAGLCGAVPTLWCGLRGWTKDEQRAVYQPFNAAIHVATLIAYAWAGRLDRNFGLALLICLPGLALGGWLGILLYRRIEDARFRRLVLWLLLASGGMMLI